MERTEIDGVPVVFEFTILHEAWECDSKGWVTKEGKLFTTSHNQLISIEENTLDGYIRDLINCMTGIISAKALVKVFMEHGNEGIF